jgi:chorismate mutase
MEPQPHRSLEALRADISTLDETLLGVLTRRLELVQEVSRRKHAGGQALRQPAREAQVLAHWRERGRTLGLDDRFVERLLELVLAEARRVQGAPA